MTWSHKRGGKYFQQCPLLERKLLLPFLNRRGNDGMHTVCNGTCQCPRSTRDSLIRLGSSLLSMRLVTCNFSHYWCWVAQNILHSLHENQIQWCCHRQQQCVSCLFTCDFTALHGRSDISRDKFCSQSIMENMLATCWTVVLLPRKVFTKW